MVPYDHQRKGIEKLLVSPRYALWWEMRLGKTSAIINTACFLYQTGLLDAVVIGCPAQVKAVWGHKEIGEIQKHCFEPYKLIELSSANSDYADMLAQATKELLFMTVSHEYLRGEDSHGGFPRVADIKKATLGKKIWVVLDEAAAFSNWKSLQTKSAMDLMAKLQPDRRTLLDGTPLSNSPICQYSKFGLLGKDILGYDSFYHYRAVHQITQPNKFAFKIIKDKAGNVISNKGSGKKYIGFQRQELIDRKVRPYCEYLESADALDMPEKVFSFLTVALDRPAWRRYCEFRDEMITQLDSGVLSAQHASVKVLRLAQLCAGFAGGVENSLTGEAETIEISCEATKAILEWLTRRYEEDPNFKCVVWCRWRSEIERLARLATKLPTKVSVVYGAKKDYNDELHPDSQYLGPLLLIAQPQALRYGVNLSRAGTEVYLSQDYNLITRAQSIERLQAPNGRSTTLVLEVLVTGPNGQRTVTWDIKRTLEQKEEITRRTANEWKIVLEKE
jgi:hypothetical protein